ncbi:MAG: hypothetical protein FWD23_01845 [Oscillospiraceae bacterium]|nr:hypothetical protein [Oscillospiraceae bacterium]
MSNYEKEKEILRTLAKKVAEISALPIQEKTFKAWKGLNSLRPERPMFMIDQLPWGELNRDGELNFECGDWLMRHFEWQLRETLYRWNHIQDDRVVTNVIGAPRAVSNTGFGIAIEEQRIPGTPGSAADSHDYKAVIESEEDIERIQTPKIAEDTETSAKWLETAKDIFGGILEVIPGRSNGFGTIGHVWDTISTWRGVEECMYDVIDRPEFTHKLLEKMFGLYHHQMDEYERLGLLDVGAPLIHCTGAYTDELPGFANESEQQLEKYRHSSKNMWTMGAAQLFSMVSPEMHDEFEIAYQMKWYERFGLGYYGCCEPLDLKIHVIAKLPNVRKISQSPWVDMERGSEAMAGRFVFSRKPNPAFLSSGTAWLPELVRKDLAGACAAAAKYNNPCELILKDVSTTGNTPERLWEWAKIAAGVCGRG